MCHSSGPRMWDLWISCLELMEVSLIAFTVLSICSLTGSPDKELSPNQWSKFDAHTDTVWQHPPKSHLSLALLAACEMQRVSPRVRFWELLWVMNKHLLLLLSLCDRWLPKMLMLMQIIFAFVMRAWLPSRDWRSSLPRQGTGGPGWLDCLSASGWKIALESSAFFPLSDPSAWQGALPDLQSSSHRDNEWAWCCL